MIPGRWRTVRRSKRYFYSVLAVHHVVLAALLCDLGEVSGKVVPLQMSPRIVQTAKGKLKGVLLTMPTARGNVATVELFAGIQYASLVDGTLRFMPPTGPTDTWDNVRVAHLMRPVCVQRIPDLEKLENRIPLSRLNHLKRLSQFLTSQAEECLYLNIYVPVRGKNETDPLPVVMFIHGETFELGTGNAYDGSVMAAFGHVIVVTVNYRLGVLGFLNTNGGETRGNYALFDLVAALQWLKENISPFGGDPNEVTLFGHGYGGALVNLLLVSPLTKGNNLFRRAIIHSGSALSTWAIGSDPLNYVRQLADAVNCTARVQLTLPAVDKESSPVVGPLTAEEYYLRLVSCFKKVPARVLMDVELTGVPRYRTAFGPNVDGRAILPSEARTLVGKQSDAAFGSTALMIGVTRNEGQAFFGQHELDEGLSDDRFRRILRTYIRNVFDYHRQKLYDVFAYDYTDWDRPVTPPNPSPSLALLDTAVEFLGDGQYVAPSVELARAHAAAYNSAPTYFYCFGSRSQDFGGAGGGAGAGTGPVSGSGQTGYWPAYGDDLPYVFGAPLVDGTDPFSSTYSRSDKILSEIVLKYWTNFIKNGKPNDNIVQNEDSRGSRVTGNNVVWPAYSANNQEYMVLGTKPVVRHHYRGSKMALWLELIPKIHRNDDLGRRFHLLDNHDNETTFEEDGTRQVLLDDPAAGIDESLLARTTQPQSSAMTISSSTTTSSTTSPTSPTPPPTTRRPTTALPTTPTRRTSTARPKAAATSTGGGMIEKVSGNVPLSVTVTVGCTLLLLNVIVFVGMYCQKRKVRLKLSMMTSSSSGGGVMMTSHDDVKSFADANEHHHGCESDNNSNGSSLSSFSLAASTTQAAHQLQQLSAGSSGQQNAYDCSKQGSNVVVMGVGRNVRFCESAMASPAGFQQTPPQPPPDGVLFSTPGGRSVAVGGGGVVYPLDIATDQTCYSDGRRTLLRHQQRASPTTGNNHCNNPSTTV